MAWGVIGGSETTHHNFVYVGHAGAPAATGGATPNVNAALAAAQLTKAAGEGNELVIYETVALGNGVQANNPWLQELPDPITRACWDNYLTIPVKYATEQGLKDGDVVRVETNGYSVEVPVLQMPGQMQGVFGLAIGYGRKAAGKVANELGANASPFMTIANGSFQAHRTGVKIEKTGKFSEIAQTQTHHTIEGRAIVKETTLAEYAKDPVAGNIRPHVTTKEGVSRPGSVSVWEERTYNGHHWVMAIDLNACTGCGACVVSCTAENNVAVVGKKEVILRREMQWIRIDRYFAFADAKGERVDEESHYSDIKDHANVEVVFQPMMCQQCNHAPCETVCPVLATLHSDEGLNQQIYNRCVGTRYCANNCPYKVRRFNWFLYSDNTRFDYNMNDPLAKMALNPDVTVRSRGVMEKCTFCVQRIQFGKLEGKKNGKRPEDGSIRTACQTSCPANAIIFGDVNDPNSEVRKLLKNERAYAVLEEINVSPNVNYLVKVRNRGAETPNA
jgi:molybdopterin-containing oxidoreductase family iron-sulfur binding subunit